LRADGDFRQCGRWRENDVKTSALPKTQNDAGVSVRRKAGMLQTNLICSGIKLLSAKKTVIIGRKVARVICQSIAKCGARTWDHSAAAIVHSPLKSGANSRNLSASTNSAKQ
jgi:hypothetical protein